MSLSRQILKIGNNKMNKYPQYLVRVIFLMSAIIFYQNCNLSSKGEWGLKEILFKHKINFQDTSYTRIIYYTARTTTDKFETRLFYDSLFLDPIKSDKEVDEICNSLDGFKFEIYDSKDKLLGSYYPNTENPEHKYSFNYNKPFSLWLHDPIKIIGGEKYKIILTVPLKRNFSEIISNPILVGGVGKEVSL